jgi:hypothetical protein
MSILQKKINKESDSRQEAKHKSHARREEARSASRHHHHSPRHSTTKACAMSKSERSSSLSPIIHHKMRYEVDDLQGERKLEVLVDIITIHQGTQLRAM